MIQVSILCGDIGRPKAKVLCFISTTKVFFQQYESMAICDHHLLIVLNFNVHLGAGATPFLTAPAQRRMLQFRAGACSVDFGSALQVHMPVMGVGSEGTGDAFPAVKMLG